MTEASEDERSESTGQPIEDESIGRGVAALAEAADGDRDAAPFRDSSATDPDATRPSLGAAFRSAGRQARTTVALLALSAVLVTALAILAVALVREVWLFDAGLTDASAVTLMTVVRWDAIAVSLLQVATGLNLLAWLHRSMVNAVPLGASAGPYSPRWAVVAWFIPFGNVVVPYRIVLDLSERLGAGVVPGPDRPLIRAWWAAYVIAALTSASGAVAPVDTQTRMIYEAVGLVVYAVAALLAISVVRHVQLLSDTRLARMSALSIVSLGVPQRRDRLAVLGPLALGIVGLLGIGITLATRPSDRPWVAYTPSDGLFTVDMPRSPSVSTSSVDSGDGDAITHLYHVEVGQNERFEVMTLDFPVGFFLRVRSEAVVNQIVTNVSAMGTGLSDSPVSTRGTAGRELRLRVKGYLAEVRIFVGDDRVYIVEADTASSGAVPSDAARFLDSFQLR